MEIKDLQDKSWKIINEYNKKHDIKYNKELVFHHLVEEVGEIARELHNEKSDWRRKFNKEKFAEEVIDALAFLLILAKDYEIDIEKTFEEKIKKLKKRFELEE